MVKCIAFNFLLAIQRAVYAYSKHTWLHLYKYYLSSKNKMHDWKEKKPTRSVEKTQMNVEIYFHCLGLIIQAFVSGSLIAFSHADYLSYSGSFTEF